MGQKSRPLPTLQSLFIPGQPDFDEPLLDAEKTGLSNQRGVKFQATPGEEPITRLKGEGKARFSRQACSLRSSRQQTLHVALSCQAECSPISWVSCILFWVDPGLEASAASGEAHGANSKVEGTSASSLGLGTDVILSQLNSFIPPSPTVQISGLLPSKSTELLILAPLIMVLLSA